MTAFCLCGTPARGQATLAQPLADFDRLVSQLKVSNLVGEPIRAGDTAIIPFARIQFGLGSGEATVGFGGGMTGKTVPLGVLIVEGDDVRAELFPEQLEKPSVLQQLVQGILERKLVIMGNGVNIGSARGTIQDLAPVVSAMMGQTTVMGQVLNFGSLNQPSSPANASVDELTKLFHAKKFPDALAVADTLIAKDTKSAELHGWRGRILSSLALTNPIERMNYGAGAGEEFEKALSLDPKNRNALLRRGIERLMAPAAYGGNVDGAIADFEAAIAQKSSGAAYCYLGEALKAKGLKDKATAAYRKALELEPNDSDVLNALAAMK